VEDEAELVGERALAGGAVGGEWGLVLLDQVLRLSANAVYLFVEMAAAHRRPVSRSRTSPPSRITRLSLVIATGETQPPVGKLSGLRRRSTTPKAS